MPARFASFALLALFGLVLAPSVSASADDDEIDPGDEYDYQEEVRPELSGDVHPVIQSPAGRPLVVVRVRTRAAWGRGPLRLLQREGPTVVDRAVDPAALPADVRASLGETLVLSGAHGRVCTARLGAPRVIRRVSPDFEYATWNGEVDEPRWSDRAVAEAAWELAEGTELLVAPVLPRRGRCVRAVWATRRAPTFAPAPTRDEPALLAAFRALPEHAALTAAWAEARLYDDDPSATHWDERGGGRARRFVSFASGSRRFTLVLAHAHDGCGDFTGVLWALFEQSPSGLTQLAASRTYTFVPTGLADLDRDGVPEILGGTQLHSTRTGTSADVEPLFLGCPC